MCLAVPGKLIKKHGDDPLMCSGQLDFGGVTRNVNLALVPEAREGDYLLVHAGIAIGVIDEQETARVLGYLEKISRDESGQNRP